VLMIRPTKFRKNEQTENDNYFQMDSNINNNVNITAQLEFDSFVTRLRNAGIKIIQFEDNLSADTPDSVFPNNWISFHSDGEVILYPMYAVNRRAERRLDIVETLMQSGYETKLIDYSHHEQKNLFLEGTGSLIFDRPNKKVYCALSERCHEKLVKKFSEEFHWKAIPFSAYLTVENQRKRIYHTNVMMSIGIHYAVICVDSIDDLEERERVVRELRADGKEIVKISQEQVHQFAGNVLQLQGKNGPLIIMSQSAYNSMTDEQMSQLARHGEIICSDLKTIETCGGGSARCMLAEVFLPKKKLSGESK